MGLLDYIIQSGQATKRNIRSLLDDPSGYANALLNRGVENTQAHLNKLTGKPYNQGNDQAYQDAMNEAALAALTVYHASPYKFDKFDMNKIGTGEGAQAYGHGLYMAESQKVSGIDGQYFNAFKNNPDAIKNGGPFSYKVDIPDEAIPRMLDWDKPLSQQSKEVQTAILATRNKLPPNAIDDMGGDLAPLYDMQQTPGDFLGTMASIGGRQDFGEKLLKESGIPGIRYLDGGSRGAGTGTYNYVLFDDQLPRILERNGVPMGNKPWAPGEYTGLLGR